MRHKGRPKGPVAAVAALLLTGCGMVPCARNVDFPNDVRSAARPVASLTGDEFGASSFPVGVALALGYPEDSTLERFTGYDVSLVYDLSDRLSLEFLVGLWDIPDVALPGGDSVLKSVPLMVGAQITLVDASSWRIYCCPGAGLSFNEYRLGPYHRADEMLRTGSSFYNVAAGDAALVQFALGAEYYPDEESEFTIAGELRYTTGTADVTESRDAGTSTSASDVNIWLARVNVSWHF